MSGAPTARAGTVRRLCAARGGRLRVSLRVSVGVPSVSHRCPFGVRVCHCVPAVCVPLGVHRCPCVPLCSSCAHSMVPIPVPWVPLVPHGVHVQWSHIPWCPRVPLCSTVCVPWCPSVSLQSMSHRCPIGVPLVSMCAIVLRLCSFHGVHPCPMVPHWVPLVSPCVTVHHLCVPRGVHMCPFSPCPIYAPRCPCVPLYTICVRPFVCPPASLQSVSH